MYAISASLSTLTHSNVVSGGILLIFVNHPANVILSGMTSTFVNQGIHEQVRMQRVCLVLATNVTSVGLSKESERRILSNMEPLPMSIDALFPYHVDKDGCLGYRMAGSLGKTAVYFNRLNI